VSAIASPDRPAEPASPPLRLRLAAAGIDGVTLLVLPGALFLIALFVYPFFYGLFLSFQPKVGGILANYQRFFSDPYFSNTIGTTMRIALPVTLLNLALAIPIAFSAC
jgi:putative spermidine/putrescine transport system permease protein